MVPHWAVCGKAEMEKEASNIEQVKKGFKASLVASRRGGGMLQKLLCLFPGITPVSVPT